MKIRSRMQALRKNSRNGFTRVELIVVLVILAVLAALLIPSLTGYIDKTRQKQIVLQTRQAVMAAQTLFDEAYGAGISKSFGKKQQNVLTLSIGSDTIADQIYELAELDPDEGVIEKVSTDETGKILTLTWRLFSDQGDGDKCEYNAENKNEPYSVVPGSN